MEVRLPATTPAQHDHRVTIVGAGPVGLTLANLLGVYGVRTLVLEKDAAIPDAPRAVALDDESLRIWQQCGLLEAIMPFVAQGEEGDVVFTYRSRSGRVLFSLTQQGRPYGFARGNVFLFHRVLEVLREGLKRFPHVELRTGWTVHDGLKLADSAQVIATDPAGTLHQLPTDYLVGCDGGRSAVRTALRIPLQGSAYAESWLIVDTRDPDLAGQPPREGVEVWCDERCPTASIPLPDGYRRWEFLLRGNRDPHANLEDASILDLIAQRKPTGNSQILRRLVHTYKGSIAERYRSGRIFLAGDAAHLSPPFAGQGMATGLRDAANLAWKLAHVIRGHARPELLDSYEPERRPHQGRMLGLARRMGLMMMPKNRLHGLLVAAFFTLVGRLPALRKKMEIRGASVSPVYGNGKGRRGGELLLQPRLASGQLLDDRLGNDFAIITFDRPIEAAMEAGEMADWQQRDATFVWLRPEGETRDAHAAFVAWLGDARRLLIVRPDRFIDEDRCLSR